MKNILRVTSIVHIVFIIWAILCVVIFIYFPGRLAYVQGVLLTNWAGLADKFMSLDKSNYILNLLVAMAGIAIYTFACTATGIWMLLRSRFASSAIERPGATFGTAFLLGQFLFSIIFLILAHYSLLTQANVLLVMFGSSLVGVIPTVKFILEAHTKLNWIHAPKGDWLFYIVICIMGTGLLLSSARLGYDAVALYFSSAKLTALAHQVRFAQADSFIISAWHTGINHAAIIEAFGDQAARMHSWVSAIIILIFCLAIGANMGLSKQAQANHIVLILTTTAFTDVMGDGKVDLASTAPAMAAIYWMARNQNAPTRVDLLFTGIFVGFAMIARPHNIFLLGILLGVYYLQELISPIRAQTETFYTFLRMRLVLIGGPVVLLLTFHLFTNWLLLGNALAPIDNFQDANTTNWQWQINPEQIWIFRLAYPLAMTFYNNPQSGGNISPLFLAFLPFLLVWFFRGQMEFFLGLRRLLYAACSTLLLWVFLIFTILEIRYVFFLWFIIFMPVAIAMEYAQKSKDLIVRFNLNALIIFMTIYSISRIIYISLDSYSPLNQRGNPNCQNMEYCDLLLPINQVAKPGDRVLTLGAYRYYLRNDLLACSTTSNEYDILRIAASRGIDEFWEEVYRQGYSYIAYEEHYSSERLFMGYIPDPATTPGWIHLTPIYGRPGDRAVSYEIAVIEPPDIKQKTCLENKDGVWEIRNQ